MWRCLIIQNTGSVLYIVLLLAFVIYRRVKRSIGFQKLQRSRLIIRTVLFAVIGIAIFIAGLRHPLYMIGDVAGLAVGVCLAIYAVKHSRFEKRQDGWYYRTHLGIELSVLFLFLGRLAYRMFLMYSQAQNDPSHPFNANPYDPQALASDPWTSGIFYVIIAYYVGYFGYLLRKEKELRSSDEQ
ncbi:CcdC protein domain-containing protein [Paenibacillus thalictri]|uniref:DUF1453 family protein n=1 Tax=Paenibacillus thalictri TaxID=2527873 RepID=A0A4Q9DZI4_9BACL|nr:CcdC protein domain-containing protein [Paenibacillus thalictri]TBL80691.1 DUF1453 family protein [Paenibacillus thalictri]